MAKQYEVDTHRGPDLLLPRLADNERVLQSAYEAVTASALPRQRIVPAEAWLLDNFYLIEQQIRLARRHLPRGYSRQLPRLVNGPSAGFPRIYDLAITLISHMDGRVDCDNAYQFIEAYQGVEPLQLGELWAFPIMLQLALLENLRRVAVRIAERRRALDVGTAWADRMLAVAVSDPKRLIHLLAEFAEADVPLTAPFVEEFYQRLQGQGATMAFVQTWLEQTLLDQGVTASELSETAGRNAAANQISIANSIASLRCISTLNWQDFVESLSAVEEILRQDPRDCYAAQDFATRDRYRHAVEDIARHSESSECDVARAAIACAQATLHGSRDRSAHVGYYLVEQGRAELERTVHSKPPLRARIGRMGHKTTLFLYASPILVLTALTVAGVVAVLGVAALGDARLWLLAVPLWVAASALAVPLVNTLVNLRQAPRSLPRMDFSAGIPLGHRTMVVVPTLLQRRQDVDDLLEAMEIRYLGNRDPNLFFALLTDFADAPQAVLSEDAALLAHASDALGALNAKYRNDRAGIFFLLHRPRVWNPVEAVWMAYERKRGKLEQFNARLRGGAASAFSHCVGDTALFPSIRYVITLDTDTQLPRDAARLLVGNLAHPLNRPVYDADLGRIVAGYAILQPRTMIGLVSAGRSRFAQLYSGEAGLDPYTREVSDVYQDLFGEGSFIGKGIYDVDAFRQAVDGRFPENLILSHDLLESGYARSALVTDVELIEEHPATVCSDASRRHRWIRGDWQLLNWLLPTVPGPGPAGQAPRQINPLSVLSRWKLLDNLRRSLVAPALLFVLAGGWLSGLGPLWLWSVLVLTVLCLPPLLSVLTAVLRRPADRDWQVHLQVSGKSTGRPLALALLSLVFLPYDAWVSLGAIQRSVGRLPFSRRGLLLWQLPIYARRSRCQSIADFYREMWIAPVVAVVLAALLSLKAAVWMLAAPVLLLWLMAPLLAWWLSRPLLEAAPSLSAAQALYLRSAARRTWRYFADFVGEQDHWLPPDNVQEYPERSIAARTSPTNIGMALLADLAAVDFGYITVTECLQRLERSLRSIEKLERYRGHLYNWYDTRSLQVLPPYYVSSVDSGNLAGSLLTLQAGLADFRAQPVLAASALPGLQDTLGVLAPMLPSAAARAHAAELTRLLQAAPDTLADAHRCLAALQAAANVLHQALPKTAADSEAGHDELAYWMQAFEQQLAALAAELNALVPSGWQGETLPTREVLAASGGTAQAQLDQIDALIERLRALAVMDFGFLYDPASALLTIGYDVGERRRDPSSYDLLASEARLASFLLIAQGQVPQKHWFALGRLLTSHNGAISLISWSGSMFEYLMPQLMMPSYPHTLLAQTYRAAVARQIEYGRQRGVPWGISESCYSATDLHQVYQYRAFGVPGLGFKRGLGDDLVIAPYASALALMVLPREAARNLQTLGDLGYLGSHGFYEAIDYTPTRVPRGKSHVIVRSFMAHHQGMSLLAFAHVLLEQPMQRRFMSDPQARATERLLQERVPQQGATLHPHAAEVSASAHPASADTGAIMRVFTEPDIQLPEVQLLSNGRYHVMATHAGGSSSRCRDLAITRWREDATADNWGTFIYVRDRDSGNVWSATYQPTLQRADYYEAIFVQGRAEYRRRDHAIDLHTEVCVSPEDDVEIRRVTLTNQSVRTRHIEITSYAEVVLAPLVTDLAHRAFSNLFVQTEILPDAKAILCTRRPRTPGERVPWMFHVLAAPEAITRDLSFETDRARFVGRGRSTVNPVALDQSGEAAALSNTDGSVLDPVVAIRRTVTLAAEASATIQIITGIADSREAALALVEKYGDRHFVERAFDMGWFHCQEVLRHLHATEADAQVFGRMANSMVFGNALRRAGPEIIARNRLGQSSLWRFAISGDLPIALLQIGDMLRLDLVKQMLQAHAYWRMNGLLSDLVIVNEDFSGYRAELQNQIIGLVNAGPTAPLLDKPGGIFLRRIEELSDDEQVLLKSVARIAFSDVTGSLVEQVERRVSAERRSDQLQPRLPATAEPVAVLAARERIFCNGLGGFTPDGREYVLTLEPGQTTPAPWVNVIASPHIGTVVSESGSAYTWVENAHEFRLTTWHNDAISDASGEALYLRDEESGAHWSLSPLPSGGKSGYVCRHGFGYTVFEHSEADIASELHCYVAMDAPVKFCVVKLRNHSSRRRQLSLTAYWELVLGEARSANQMHIVTDTDAHTGALFARNAYGRECNGRVVFAQVSERERSVSGNRAEFIGRNRSLANPAAMGRKRLSGRTGAGYDPCAALQTRVELGAGQEREIVFVLGAAPDAAAARQLIQRFGGRAGARSALEAVWEYWNRTLGAVNVQTPDPALNVLANGWLVYQTLSCRLWARSGYYQSGGAYGFRDQLQDVVALLHATPWLAREQLLRHAGRQFIQGDVQHWWHPPNGQGVRTHFSDDYLWLPYATCRYVQATGDTGVLDESVGFLEGRELYADEEAYYDQPRRSEETASLYDHCVRALRHGLRFGVHGLPLMGCGDWNDGMNLVGKEGKGESVWLAWFLLDNLEQFARLAASRNDDALVELCKEQAVRLREAIEAQAWDGAWYRRAWFDDGTPLGSSVNADCQIDSISQSWAVISGAGDPQRTQQALASVDARLVRREQRIIQLLDPPFDSSALEPGYIKGYIPGVRENGGQYTHAAIWTTMAFAQLGDAERAWELYELLNPIRHSDTPEAAACYRVEPYVMCADIYGVAPHTGRGGWTWYTGAAGWMYRLTLETLLGLTLEVDHLRITPCVPAAWQSYTMHYRYRDTLYHITVQCCLEASMPHTRVSLDGVDCPDARIPLIDDRREHLVVVQLNPA